MNDCRAPRPEEEQARLVEVEIETLLEKPML